MNIQKSYAQLKQLNSYGEIYYYEPFVSLEEQGLLARKDNQYIITNNWIIYAKNIHSEINQLISLFCFEENYQKYLVEVVLLTSLRMSEINDTEGIEDFVSNLPTFSNYGVSVLKEIIENDSFLNEHLENRLKQKEEQFQNLNRFIFDGPPHYQRVMYYLKHVQAYKHENVIEDMELGKKIDDQWQKGRKISTNLFLPPLKERPLYMLVPFISERKIDQPQFQQLFTYPWKLFAFLCCIVREHFETQGVQAIRFQVIGDEVDVLLTSSNYQQYRYGTFDEFTVEFCKVSRYQLFPYEIKDLQTVFQDLTERKLLRIVDGEYRLPTDVEDIIYNTNIYIPLIAESKQLRSRIEQWIDGLRGK